MILVIAEKPSLGRDIADALPGERTGGDKRYIEKGEYVITWVFGHMLTLKEPEDYDAKYKKWSVADLPTYLGISTNSLAVAPNGKRFASETGIAMLDPWIAGPNYYSIWSTEQLKEIQEKGFKYNMNGVAAGFLGYCGAIPENLPLPETFDVLDKAIEMGFVFKADTIEELAEKAGIDPAALKETVDRYNSFSESGVDEDFGKDGSLIEKIGEGPYYAVKMASYSYNTVAGLDITRISRC